VSDENDREVREGEQPSRILGIPRLEGSVRPEEFQSRVLGIPTDWFAILRARPDTSGFDVRRLAHPVRWWKWRRQVHRLGPYAPDYDDGETARRDDRGKSTQNGKEVSAPPRDP
jgi:hypothetical protein